MGQAIGESLPIAVGIALSPIPIVAVVLMLLTPRGRLNGPMFVLGWWIGLALVGVIVGLFAGGLEPDDGGETSTWLATLELVLGVALLLVAVRQWRGRPRGDAEPPTPKWMGALDTFTPVKAGGAGVALSALNPKNLLLAVSGAAAIVGTGISTGENVAAYAVFVLVASVGVAAPVVIYFIQGPTRSARLLDALKSWMVRHNAVVMAVLLLIIGAKLIGDAISGFTS
jgi:threonine/homoserine/homoserine lactone efflux protein